MNNRRITLMRPSQMFDSMLDEFFNAPSRVGRMLTDENAIDLSEDDEHIYLEVSAPGFKKDDIEISVEDGMFTISGKIEVSNEEDSDTRTYHVRERSVQSFSRTVALPARVDAENASAKVEDGVVKVTLPKLAESRAKKIAISAD